ncbi:MAG: toll/interleukin-1 receptor domain-containing protein [Hydrogenophaga sp.]|nr:toll/interleukin-1 receptor domain-containing protein [Hydrogenophaga sp.]
MKKSVFISHASKNFKLADSFRAWLEEKGVSCWIAPRDIPKGGQYGASIVDAIKDCSVFLLILTKESNISAAVANEVERAFSYQKTIVPVRVDDIRPQKEIEFFVSNAQWMDAIHTPLKSRTDEIAQIVHAIEMGAAAPKPKEEVVTAWSRVDRWLESAFRHKALTFAVIFLLLMTASFAALYVQADSAKNIATIKDGVSSIEVKTDSIDTTVKDLHRMEKDAEAEYKKQMEQIELLPNRVGGVNIDSTQNIGNDILLLRVSAAPEPPRNWKGVSVTLKSGSTQHFIDLTQEFSAKNEPTRREVAVHIKGKPTDLMVCFRLFDTHRNREIILTRSFQVTHGSSSQGAQLQAANELAVIETAKFSEICGDAEKFPNRAHQLTGEEAPHLFFSTYLIIPPEKFSNSSKWIYALKNGAFHPTIAQALSERKLTMRLTAYNGNKKRLSANIADDIEQSGGAFRLRTDVMGELVLFCMAGPNIVDVTKKSYFIQPFNFRTENNGKVWKAIETTKTEAKFVSEAEFSEMCM